MSSWLKPANMSSWLKPLGVYSFYYYANTSSQLRCSGFILFIITQTRRRNFVARGLLSMICTKVYVCSEHFQMRERTSVSTRSANLSATIKRIPPSLGVK